MSAFNMEQMNRAFKSIEVLKEKGEQPTALEISSDIWGKIQLGGLNMFPGEKIFAGLPVVEIYDKKDHVAAVSYPFP